MKYASRVRNLVPEGAYAVLARAMELEAQGKDIIHLEIGQPDFDTFSHICFAGVRAIIEGKTRYNPPAGLTFFRETVARTLEARIGATISPRQVVISPGAKPVLFFTTLAVIEPGDEVIYPDPGFPTYRAMIEVAGGIPVPIPLLESAEFSLDLEKLNQLINSRTRLIILNSPSNPTGGVIPLDDLVVISELASKHGCWVISDEIYSQIVYEGLTVPSIASLPNMLSRTIIVDGFSKTYAMTGWRLGFGILPEKLARSVELLLTHSVGCTATFTQHAGNAALIETQEPINAIVLEYEKRRDLIVDRLNAIQGVSCLTPKGAFYVFPNLKSFRQPSSDIAEYLLEEANVAVLPGSAFGTHGEGYLRISYANSLDKIEVAMERIAFALGKM